MSLARLLPVAAPVLALLAAAPPAGAADQAAIARLRAESRGRVELSLHPATGVVRFARPAGPRARLPQPVAPAAKAATAEERAQAFLARHGKAFGIARPATELVLERRQVERDGATHLRYRQVYQGVPVFAGALRVHLAPAGAITAVNGTIVPDLALDPRPRLAAPEAAAIAGGGEGAGSGGAAPRLVVFRAGLIRGVPGPDHLAWEVATGAAAEREHVYVDAHTGKVIDRIDVSPEALRREVYLGTAADANLKWSEGQATPYSGSSASENGEINNLIEFTRDAYDFFQALAAYDAWDGRGSAMKSVANATTIDDCPNASWNGRTTNFCPGTTYDDVVAHEWGHAYTQSTHDLVYQWQPGALNEAYSDIWGETVDQLNGAGTDDPGGRRSDGGCSTFTGGGGSGTDNSYRWLIGEGAGGFGSAIRDMWTPACRNDPNRVTESRYHCSTGDNGGVHTNSGVANHAYALLVDGGGFNGQSVPAIGMVKAAHVYWRAADLYQVSASDFADHADALEQSCRDLQQAGTNLRSLVDGAPSGQVVSAADCEAVRRAIAAVELRARPHCSFEPILLQGPPALCASGTPANALFESFENGFGGWQRSHQGVHAEYDPLDWEIDATLPGGRAGRAAFAFDTVRVGDCVPGSDDQSGVMRLTSPPLTAPAGGTRVAFQHYVATELEYDGGNLKVSVDGGEFQLVPRSAFRFNPYNEEIVVENNDNPLEGQPAWSGTDEGSVRGSWGQSQVDLAGIVAPGQPFRLRFDFGVDGCNGVDGWYVDDVQVYSCTSGGPTAPCVEGPNTLCLLGKRYQVEVDWENQFDGSRGRGLAIPSTDFAGMWAFTDPANVELMVKLLDFGEVVKAFYGQLTDLRFTMRVTDTQTGAQKTYGNTPGNCGAIDQAAFQKIRFAGGAGVAKAAACTPGPNTLCLLANRFRVEVDWRNQFNGAGGRGGAAKLSELAGTFSFDDARNTELLVKTLDFGDQILVIYGALSDLGYTIRVTDTTTETTNTYVNAPGTYCGAIDGDAF
jgi:Zn-dependent metalloprotease